MATAESEAASSVRADEVADHPIDDLGRLNAPPETWQRLLAAFQRWCARHPRFMQRLRRIVRVAYLVAAILLLFAVAFLPRFGHALIPAVFMTLGLAVMTLLARTRTIAWRTAAVMLGLAVPWALVVALSTVAVADAIGMRTSDQGMSISLAAYVEEPGKLVPLLLLCLLAPGRVRRFAATDWALLGYALGAGFVIAEDGVRRLNRPGLWEALFGGTPYSLNPWTSARFVELGEAVAPGHQVWTSNTAMGIGLGIVLWRTKAIPGHRVWAWLLPVALFALSVSEHAAYNASAALLYWPDEGGDGYPTWMLALWTVTGHGRLSIPLSVILLVICLLVDARRRVRANWYGVTTSGAPRVWQPRLAGLPGLLRIPLQSVTALVTFTWSDLVVYWAAHVPRGMTRGEAIFAGRAGGVLVRGTRADAMAVTTPGREPATRRWFLVAAALIGSIALATALIYGGWVAREIGSSLLSDRDHPFFAGLLRSLAQWWDSIGPLGQIGMIALGVALIIASGGSLALALGATGVLAWGASRGAGLATFIENPREATLNYFRTVTPGQLAWDILDFGLTFIPGSILGKMGGVLGRGLVTNLRGAKIWRRVPGSALTKVDDLFRNRASWIRARDAATKALDDLIPPGFTRSDFSMGKWLDTSALLREQGYTADQINRLYQASADLARARAKITSIGAQIGETGGEAALREKGYVIPDAFLSAKGTPGGKLLDGFGVKQGDGLTQITVPEYKGVGATLDQTKRPTIFEGPAAQGTPAYVRDRLLTDPRVADFFADNPDLWAKAKAGQVDWNIQVISTKGAGVGDVVISEEAFELTPEVIDALDDLISAKVGG